MSTYKHRLPIINWSSVVLLSALLLSPMSAATFLHALSQALPLAFAPGSNDHAAPPAEPANTGAPARRANDEQETLRRAIVKAARLRNVRLDTDPLIVALNTGTTTVAVLVPTRSTERIADETADTAPGFRPANAAIRDRIIAPTPPRAPPVA